MFSQNRIAKILIPTNEACHYNKAPDKLRQNDREKVDIAVPKFPSSLKNELFAI